ncbi:hypothetical protein [Bacteroides helcogenes]|uniref:hypothetical protein n=1 Tax=Bacteroides helcogenes TaxID=290053 RepID=UPI000312471A|nr:hypothetical protein [Bacteroides helcogenes]MDY5237901.1 hypothetical protein [Bacteroides helcogenes]
MVIADIIRWWKSGYLVTESSESVKALVDWTMERYTFLSKELNPLAYNTIIAEFREVWRDLQQEATKAKNVEICGNKKKIPHNN